MSLDCLVYAPGHQRSWLESHWQSDTSFDSFREPGYHRASNGHSWNHISSRTFCLIAFGNLGMD